LRRPGVAKFGDSGARCLQSRSEPADGKGSMARSPRVWSPFLLLFGVACSTTSYVADLAKNDLFYADVPFVTKAPGDRPVFVAPVADARDPSKLPTVERGFPIVYGGDDFWERPVPEMVGEVLQRQLERSHLFAALQERAAPEALVLKPTLLAFTTGRVEGMSGQRSLAEFSLRVQIHGPVGCDGKRPVLHEQIYLAQQTSPQELNPTSPYRLIGRAAQAAIGKLLTQLDGSNIARSEVPADPARPAEASAAPAR
jgi:hypothetical protein